jgi:hypothetical protein
VSIPFLVICIADLPVDFRRPAGEQLMPSATSNRLLRYR